MPLQSNSEALAQWEELSADPRLAVLAYKMETNGAGQIIMSPPKNRHSLLQSVLYDNLKASSSKGLAVVEFVLLTSDGVKVPDVIWGSAAWYQEHGTEDVALQAPELCAEIMSGSNSLPEMEQKMNLYFEKGCEEFILVDTKGHLKVFSPEGPLKQSRLFPNIPQALKIPTL